MMDAGGYRRMRIPPWFRRLYWICSGQLGVDVRKTARALGALPGFIRDYSQFRRSYSGRIELVPCLHERSQEGGSVGNEYFWQDLYVAQKIFQARPDRHVDIGSRIDGFVAHVAAFREIEVFDIRPVTARIPGVTFRQADLMQPLGDLAGCCDSLSCLHALEHFGLGRYGDPIDPQGFDRGLANLARLLRPAGVLYLSVPLGRDRVEFNANRVIDPRRILELARVHRVRVDDLTTVGQDGRLRHVALEEVELESLARQRYTLGIFTLRRMSDDGVAPL